MDLYDHSATKRPVNVSINSDLVAKARKAGMNLSALAEDAIAVAYARTARAKWDEEIRRACEAHKLYIAEHGTLSEAVWAMEDEASDGEAKLA